jgi:adenylate cyclase
VSQLLKIRLKKVFIIMLFCFLAGAYFATVETVFQSSIILGGYTQHGPLFVYLSQCLAGIFGGGFFAVIDVFFLRRYFRQKSFGLAIFIESLVFVALFLLVSLLVSNIYLLIYNDAAVNSNSIFIESLNYFLQPAFYLNFLNWMIVLVIVLIFLQVGDKFGEGAFMKFFLGKYHKPKEEMRVFMFLDIKNSTGIAEQLGHTNYFKLLKDFYSDVTYPILRSRGEIYQYVGDEITINWQLNTALENSNCIKCFFDIKELLENRKEYYLERYGVFPEFKAGIHFGLVTVGEIGIIKREIVYSGDLLNTTARIMEECRKQKKDFLISKDLSDSLEQNHNYNISHIGAIELRGKQQKIDLLSITV